MIKLVFTIGREVISFEIENKIIYYQDRKFTSLRKNSLMQNSLMKIIPLDRELKKKLLMPRINRIPQELIRLIREANQGKNKKEYDDAKDDEELVIIIKRDAASKGCVFQKRIDN